jgi:hypothetical protein
MTYCPYQGLNCSDIGPHADDENPELCPPCRETRIADLKRAAEHPLNSQRVRAEARRNLRNHYS